MWSSHCPLSRFLTPRDIAREGYSIQTRVADLLVNGAWNWPLSWLAKAPNLGLIPAPNIVLARQDCMKWRATNGTMTDFSVKCAWEVLRPRGIEVPWLHTVWFSHAIPRHAFHLWLVMRRSLKTQDKLRQWDVAPTTDITQVRCSLCGTQPDSHEHLFFECSYSSKVWTLIRGLVGMDMVPPVLDNILVWFQPIGNKRTIQNIIGKILFAAASYFIWLERKNRLFKNNRRTPEELRDAIVVTVRLKLTTSRFKNKAKVHNLISKQEENLRKNLNNDMRSILGSFFQNQASTSGTLLSNTIPNPKGEMKAITTRSGATLAGPSVPPPPPSKEVEREPETKMD
ncbi:putative reverse transcriptase domain-containing protein [Tanacetum coccineum]